MRAARVNDYPEFFGILRQFKTSNIRPSATTYQSLIGVLGRNQLVRDIWETLDDMETVGVKPDDGCMSQVLLVSETRNAHSFVSSQSFRLVLMTPHNGKRLPITWRNTPSSRGADATM